MRLLVSAGCLKPTQVMMSEISQQHPHNSLCSMHLLPTRWNCSRFGHQLSTGGWEVGKAITRYPDWLKVAFKGEIYLKTNIYAGSILILWFFFQVKGWWVWDNPIADAHQTQDSGRVYENSQGMSDDVPRVTPATHVAILHTAECKHKIE